MCYVFLAYSLPFGVLFFSKFFSQKLKSFLSVVFFRKSSFFITLREIKERKRPERCLPPPQENSLMMTTSRIPLLLLLLRMKRKRRLGRKEKRKKRREGKENPVGNLIKIITRTHQTTKQKKKGRGQIRRKEKRSHFHLHLLFQIIIVPLITSWEE